MGEIEHENVVTVYDHGERATRRLAVLLEPVWLVVGEVVVGLLESGQIFAGDWVVDQEVPKL